MAPAWAERPPAGHFRHTRQKRPTSSVAAWPPAARITGAGDRACVLQRRSVETVMADLFFVLLGMLVGVAVVGAAIHWAR